MNESTNELQLGDYLGLFRRRWRWIAAIAAAVVAVVALFTFAQEPVYSSTGRVVFLTENNETQFGLTESVAERLARSPLDELSYVEGRFNNLAAEELGRADDPPTAQYALVVSNEDQDADTSGVMRFTVEGSSAGAAADAANSYLESYVRLTHENDVRNFTRQLEATQRTIERLEADLAEINEPRTALVRQLNNTTDAVQQAALERQIQVEAQATEGARALVRSELNAATTESFLLRQVLDELENPEASSRVDRVANPPGAQDSPNVMRNLLLAAVIGLVLAVIIAITRDLLDGRARDGSEVAQLVDVPVIAAIGQLPNQRSAPGGVRRFADLSDADASGYRILLNSLWLATIDGPLQSLAVTSDRPGVGKTQTVVNLAQAEAARGTRVLIIDADSVNPSVAERLELEPFDSGLGDLLSASASIDTVLRSSGIPNLDVIGSFRPDEHAADLLRSDRLREILTTLYVRYDLILLDSPPTLSTADSRIVASQADAAIVVYDPSESRVEELERTIELLRSARVNLSGLVTNRSLSPNAVYASTRER